MRILFVIFFLLALAAAYDPWRDELNSTMAAIVPSGEMGYNCFYTLSLAPTVLYVGWNNQVPRDSHSAVSPE